MRKKMVCLLAIAAMLVIFGFIIVHTLDDDGEITILYFCLIIAIVLFIGIVYIPYRLNEYGCEKKAVAQGLEYKYGWFEGCLVKEPSEKNFIDYDRYRVMK
jgi:hypothetical protein